MPNYDLSDKFVDQYMYFTNMIDSFFLHTDIHVHMCRHLKSNQFNLEIFCILVSHFEFSVCDVLMMFVSYQVM